ncbi:hypothetical protein [Methylobacterium radiodurans]|uniref:Uncharacterized protein n=1 Tax=Methylobacterium radiodurans TaxID=2202828 RepID=A0A2U8VZG7_9HYPH|nr:hypothetical protein [Methylobacterium radiodurans]AWN38466.1 hypothetical protein DK427_24310 [Methylobacterium radiodurans]
MKTQTPDIDPETAWLVQRLVREGSVFGDTATILTIEKLRRLEDLARRAGTSRQAFQKIASARRILGDHAELGPIPDFMGDADMNPFDLTENELRVPAP